MQHIVWLVFYLVYSSFPKKMYLKENHEIGNKMPNDNVLGTCFPLPLLLNFFSLFLCLDCIPTEKNLLTAYFYRLSHIKNNTNVTVFHKQLQQFLFADARKREFAPFFLALESTTYFASQLSAASKTLIFRF